MKKKSIWYFLFFTLLSISIIACKHQSEKNLVKEILLSENWEVQSSSSVNTTGDKISSAGISTQNWYRATIPSTVMGTLIKAGLYPDILSGKNIEKVDKKLFDVSWWYRTEFQLPVPENGRHVSLSFDGISYYANIWLNGHQIASRDSVFGPFRRFSFDITPYIQKNNVLAVEVFRAQPGDPNIGFVDWNPRPCDENMGIFREVKVNITGNVSMVNTVVKSKVETKTGGEAWLTVQTELKNLSEQPVSGILTGKIETGEFFIPVTLNPNEKKQITLTSKDIEMLHIKSPRLWWCSTLGKPELYELNLQFIQENTVSDRQQVTFGIREIETYFTEKGDRGFILNGKKVLIKGAGWTDDMFLRDTPETNEIQIQYARDMYLNLIRFENVWGTSRNLYELCDRYGLMAFVGWSCQWEWEAYFGKPCDEKYGCITSEKDRQLIARSFEDQVLWLRNHPSIIAWFAGSDMLPHPELEKKYLEILSRTDNRPYIASAKRHVSEVSGNTGTKMTGPYEYVGPAYWYIDTVYGGAYGFNTETGIGAQIPVKESILKMIPESEMWPLNDVWSFHCTTSGTAMNSLNILTNVISNKYGQAKNLDDYLLKANLVNYDGTKAMFEAFRVHMTQATGVVQWMLNSAWPSLYWQLYDYYLIPTSGYYGTRKANNPQQLIYNYKDHAVYVVNETPENTTGKAVIQLFDTSSKLLKKEEIGYSAESGTSQKIFQLEPQQQNLFLSLQIFDQENNLDADNFYCLPVTQDQFDWAKTTWVYTPAKAYADYQFLNDLPEAELKVNFVENNQGDVSEIILEVTNSSPVIAYFIQLKLKDDRGEILYPVYWSDNCLSLLPGEKRVIRCYQKESLLSERNNVECCISGWNIQKKKINVIKP